MQSRDMLTPMVPWVLVAIAWIGQVVLLWAKRRAFQWEPLSERSWTSERWVGFALNIAGYCSPYFRRTSPCQRMDTGEVRWDSGTIGFKLSKSPGTHN